MTAPVIANTSTNTGNSATATGLKPSNTADGDLLIAFVATDNYSNTITYTTPAGWEKLQDLTGSASSTPYARAAVFWKIAASEGASWNFGGSASEQWIVIVLRITGHDSTTPINIHDGTSFTTTGTSILAPSVTTTEADCLIVVGGGQDGGAVAISYSFPAGTTELFDMHDGSSAIYATLGYRTQASSGASGTTDITSTVSEQRFAWTAAVAPGGTAAEPVEESISLARIMTCGQPAVQVSEESLSLGRTAGIGLLDERTGAAVEESLTLSVTLQCAEPLALPIEESITVSITLTASASAQAAAESGISLGRTQADGVGTQAQQGTAALLTRILADAVTSGQVAQSGISLGRSQAVTGTPDALAAQSGISLGRSAVIEVQDERTASEVEESVTLSLTLRCAQPLTPPEPVFEDGLTLSAQRGILLADEVIAGSSLSLGRSLAVETSYGAQAITESIDLGRSHTATSTSAGILVDALALGRSLNITSTSAGILANSLIMAHSLAYYGSPGAETISEALNLSRSMTAVLAGFITLNDAVLLGRTHTTTAGAGAEASAVIGLARLAGIIPASHLTAGGEIDLSALLLASWLARTAIEDAHVIAPFERLIAVGYENRLRPVSPENRAYQIGADGRIYRIGPDGRLYPVAAESRLVEVNR